MTNPSLIEIDALAQATQRINALLDHSRVLARNLKEIRARDARNVKFIRFMACGWAATIFVAFWGWAR